MQFMKFSFGSAYAYHTGHFQLTPQILKKLNIKDESFYQDF